MGRISLVVGGVLVLIVGAAGCATPQRWVNQPLLGPVDLAAPIFSPDGTQLAFVSGESFVPQDTNGVRDVYLRDLTTGVTILASVNAAGTDGGNDQSGGPVFSPDGSRLSFWSAATDLTSTPSSGGNIYLRNLAAGTTTMVSVNSTGAHGVGGYGPAPISPDGTKVVFTSYTSDAGPTDSNHLADVYMRDVAAGTTTLVSINGTGTDSGNNAAKPVGFAAGGTKVIFESDANDLGPTDTNGGAGIYDDSDIYARNLATGTTTLVSTNSAGTDSGNGGSLDATVSHDGTRVAFASGATDLVPGVPTRTGNIYVRDLVTGSTVLASPAGSGSDGGDDWSGEPHFSPDGSKLVFRSMASNLGPADQNGKKDVYVRDLVAGATILVSVNAAGTSGGNAASSDDALAVPSFSPDGTKVAFVSLASDLGPADTAMCDFDPKPYPPVPCPDVYVRDLIAGTTALVSGDGTSSTPNTFSGAPAFSPVANDELAYLRNSEFYTATEVS